jgi:putative SOS response-associated peptidase YedK
MTMEILSCRGVLVHDRMPVILMPEDYDGWLDPGVPPAGRLKALLRPLPDDWMVSYPVSKLVNSPRNEKPECIARVESRRGRQA